MTRENASSWRLTADSRDDAVPILISPTLGVNRDNFVETPNHTLLHTIAHRRVTLVSEEPSLFVLWLFFLSGWAHQVLLLPADLNTEQVQAYSALADSELIVTQQEFSGRQERIHPNFILESGPTTADGTNDKHVDTSWLLATSGTTGTPKIVRHTSATLAATVQRDPVRGNAFRWGLLYDPARFAGLQVVLQALLGGSTLVVGHSTQTFEDRLRYFAKVGVNTLSATPTQWRKMLMFGLLDKLELRQITLGGEIADQRLLDTLAARFPKARITHVYASTEAGVGFSVKDGREGFPLPWLTEPPPGIEMSISADNELLVRSNRTGLGYHLGVQLKDADNWVWTGDIVQPQADRVYFRGRRSGVINVGGDKIHPEVIERVLLEHPWVVSALVRPRRSSFTGSLVEAIVVPSSPNLRLDELRRAIIEHCRTRLPRYAIPALIQVADDLPVNKAGKLERES